MTGSSARGPLERLVWRLRGRPCAHLDQIRHVVPSRLGCGPCLDAGSRWVHLRLCLTCGHVGCCNESEGKHARAHFDDSGHPIIRSHELGEDWRYCWMDEVELAAPRGPR